MMINERGKVGGIEIGKKAEVFGENPSQCHSTHHKSHRT
jgi:hypothetical protein